jgi:hydrogenase-1 operon protein HyaF
MQRIETISIETETPSIPAGADATCTPCSVPTGNLLPLLHEIRHALNRWLNDGTVHIIDLRSIPMAPHEETQLLETLGRGEIQATLSALGNSEIFETGIAGVWLVSHHNDDGVLVGRFIEICHVPEILKSQTEDARFALQALDNLLATAEISK